MEDESVRLSDKAQELGDVELALLLCLVAGEHCIIEVDAEDIDDTEQELQSICRSTFGLKSALLRCKQDTSIDEFDDQIMIQDAASADPPTDIRHDRHHIVPSLATVTRTQSPPRSLINEDKRKIADVVIARDLHLAPHQVQVQALELMRSKRIFTRKAIYTAPKRFLLVALNTAEVGSRMMVHLNDQFFISHYHQPRGMAEEDEPYQHDNPSSGSVFPPQPLSAAFSRHANFASPAEPLFPDSEIDALAKLSTGVKLHPDVRAYMHDVVVFMRMHRAVASGVTPHATRHLYTLTRILAPVHGLDFITPSLVALAVRKIYPSRLTIVRPEDEMSLQWGSDLDAVKEYLDGFTAEDVIEDILERVETPL